MLSTKQRHSSGARARPGSAKRARTAQRAVHLLTGLVLVIYVYATPSEGSWPTMLVRWLVLPSLVATGLAMWQWPRLRRLAREHGLLPR